MAKVSNRVETLLKISTGWVRRTNVTDRRQTDGRTTTYSERSRSLIILAMTCVLCLYIYWGWISVNAGSYCPPLWARNFWVDHAHLTHSKTSPIFVNASCLLNWRFSSACPNVQILTLKFSKSSCEEDRNRFAEVWDQMRQAYRDCIRPCGLDFPSDKADH